jgi:hypothetical protein
MHEDEEDLSDGDDVTGMDIWLWNGDCGEECSRFIKIRGALIVMLLDDVLRNWGGFLWVESLLLSKRDLLLNLIFMF